MLYKLCAEFRFELGYVVTLGAVLLAIHCPLPKPEALEVVT